MELSIAPARVDIAGRAFSRLGKSTVRPLRLSPEIGDQEKSLSATRRVDSNTQSPNPIPARRASLQWMLSDPRMYFTTTAGRYVVKWMKKGSPPPRGWEMLQADGRATL